MRTVIILISLLTITSCTRKYNLSKIVKENNGNYNIFISQSYEDERANKFYGATTPRQVDLIVKGLKLKLWRGYWDGAEIDGIIIAKNNFHFVDIQQNIIIKSNFNEFKDSLSTFKRKYRLCDKKKLVPFIDSLKSYDIPYYLDGDTSTYYGEQFFKIKYDLGVNKYPSKKQHPTIRKTTDSIIELFKKTFPDRVTRIKDYTFGSRDGIIELNIAVTANEKTEINNPNAISFYTIKSIKFLTADNYKPIEYYINYFVRQKNAP